MPSRPIVSRATALSVAQSPLRAWPRASAAADSARMRTPVISGASIGERPPGAPPGAPGARTLIDVFAQTVSRFGDRIAVDAPDTVLSYEELSREVDELAARLRSIGIGAGDRVGVRVSSGAAQLYVAILGVLRSGAAYVPVDAEDPPARVEAIWKAAGVCAVIEEGLAIRELAPGCGGGLPVTVDDDAWVIFTSGSTGTPKGVAVSHRSAAAFVDAETRLWTVSEEDRVLAGLSVGFDASCEEMWLAWRNGAALVPAPRAVVRAGADLGPWLAERGVSVVSTVPTLAAMLDEDVIAGVRLLILGGEACPTELGWRLAARREVWNTYGPTEATVVSTAARIRPGEPVTIGLPLDGWQTAVVDEHGEPVGLGEPGELVISGVGLGRYLDPRLDAERFAPLEALGWERAYRTGDTVRELIDGFDFVGRRDEQVKIAGRRLELGEIDAQLRALPGVKAAAAAVRKSASGNSVLVGYVTGDVDPSRARAALAERLPDGIVPLIVVLDSLPLASSGKLSRNALPWPPPHSRTASADGTSRTGSDPAGAFTGTAAWLAERWTDQLGVAPGSLDGDFFELGGTSLAVAKLVSVIRGRFPAAAVADVYNHRRLGELAARLDETGEADALTRTPPAPVRSRRGLVQLAGVLVLLGFGAMQWLVGILAYNRWQGAGLGPQVGWGWLIAAWVLLVSAPGRAMIVLVARRVLLGRLKPGRYPRRGRLACRLWFVERLAEICRLDRLAGTPWAVRYARICGAEVGAGARLGTLPPVTGLLRIGAGATLEGDVDVHGWWIDGDELVVGELRVGPGARIGTRAVLMPGADIGAGAEVEPGSVVGGHVPAGERWAGSPARYEGPAGTDWPSGAPEPSRRRRRWKFMYGVGLAAINVLPLLAAVPGVLLLSALGPGPGTLRFPLAAILASALVIAASFLVSYALLVAVLVRGVARLLVPGWHSDDGGGAWALWFTEALMAGTRGVLFPLYSSLYTRRWLRLLGLRVGGRTEVSTPVGLNRLATLGETSFLTDDVVFATGRARDGWLQLAPIEVGSRTFIGNSAILRSGTKLGDDSLVGLLSSPPTRSADGTSWLGLPALELPRVPERPDPARTTAPPRRLVLARGAIDLVRILLPSTVSVTLGLLVVFTLESIGRAGGSVWVTAAAAPLVLSAASVGAVLVTVALKWLLMGRYRVGEHPLWSPFVWRDEIINTCQEQLAGAWLLNLALGTPLLSIYLRAMGAKVGKDVWFESLNVTEFDLVRLGDGCTVNRGACIETHLFHDRLMRTGPAGLGPGSTLGPGSAVLPDTVLGANCSVGARSFVMRGEQLPAQTRWHGAPVVSV
jgi:non-ribosomal peptide synthetase-like protein